MGQSPKQNLIDASKTGSIVYRNPFKFDFKEERKKNDLNSTMHDQLFLCIDSESFIEVARADLDICFAVLNLQLFD
jgi:hypothetical protein